MTGFVPPTHNPRISVRDVNENPIGQIPDFSEGDFIPKFNGVGGWRIKMPATAPGADLFRPGCGITAVMPDGFRFTGQMTSRRKIKGRDDRGGTLEVSGVEDTAILGFRCAWPSPGTALGFQGNVYNRTGPAESVMWQVVNSNMGPGNNNFDGRRIPNLRLEPDQGRGPTSPISLRYDNILEVCQRVLTPAGLGFSVKAEPGGYVYSTTQARDLSQDLVFSEERGNLEGWEYVENSPNLTRALMGGQGEGAARTILRVIDPTTPSLETTWGFMIEQFLDRRDTNVTAELQQAAYETFAQMNNQYSLSIDPTDTPDFQLGGNYFMGDRIGVKVDGTTYTDTITQIHYQFRPGSYRNTPTIGAAESVGGRALDIYRVVRLIASRVGLLEKRY